MASKSKCLAQSNKFRDANFFNHTAAVPKADASDFTAAAT
jgi:hypothetical protein